ncbi:MAG: Ig-like domain-containing protein [Candidatus Babeliales bacterium]
MIKFNKNILAVIVALNAAITTVCAPIALNDASTLAKNTSVDIAVLANDLANGSPLVPSSVALVDGPFFGSALVSVSGVVTYEPYTDFVGTDYFEYSVSDEADESDEATVYITVYDPDKPCPTVCPDACCKNQCFDKVFEGGWSLANFTQTNGTWSSVNGHFTTTGAPRSFLQYNNPVSQTYQIFEVLMEFPDSQPANTNIVGGMLSKWNGSDESVPGPNTFYITFDTDGDGQIGSTPVIAAEGFRLGGGASSTYPSLQLGQYYKITLVVTPVNAMSVYINDVHVLDADPVGGTQNGDFIGLWAARGTVNYKSFRSCSYTTTPPYPPAF